MNTLGTRIRELRIKKGLTQAGLAKGICTPSMISQCESDKSRPSYRILSAIAERLDVSLDYLLDGVFLQFQSASKATMAKALVEAGNYRLALQLLEDLQDSDYMVMSKDDLAYHLGLCYVHVSRIDEAVSRFNSLIESSLVRDDKHRLVLALLGLGNAMAQNKVYQLAVHHTEQALSTYEKMNEHHPDLHCKILLQLAKINKEIGQVHVALRYYRDVAELQGCNTSIEQSAKLNLNLSEACYTHGDYEKSHLYAARALVQFMEAGNIEDYQDAHIQLLLLNHDESNWQSTVKQLLAIAVDYEEQESKRGCAGKLFAGISVICHKYGDIETAVNTAEDAVSILTQADHERGMALRTLGLVSYSHRDFEKGKHFITEAIETFREAGSLSELEEVTYLLARSLNESGQHHEAFSYLEQYQHYIAYKLQERGILL